MDPKQRAGEAALDFVRDGMIVGLGTGSTARFFIQALGGALRSGRLRDIRCVPTSVNSERLAGEAGLSIVTFAQVSQVDITIDGADEIGPDLMLIKGLGGALLREKLVAQNSTRLVIIADSSKVVTQLGTHCSLPVEVTPFGNEASRRFLESLGCQTVLRLDENGQVFVTDNGNYIFDCKFAGIDDPRGLNQKLSTRSGIVESGLFLDIADTAIIADDQGVQLVTRPVPSVLPVR